MEFRWNRWNIEHVERHGVKPEEAEAAVRQARKPYPRAIGEDKLLVWAPGLAGELLQVVFVLDLDGTVFVVHARRLTHREKQRYRRQRR